MAAGIKLAIFTLASILVTGLLAAILGNFGFGPGKVYKAEFTRASQLEKGDDVPVAVVALGEVKKGGHFQRNRERVTYRLTAEVAVTTETRAKHGIERKIGGEGK